MSAQLQQYIESRINGALDALESGVQMQNVREIRLAMATLQSIEGIIGLKRSIPDEDTNPATYKNIVRDAMVRACSAMCALDKKNALQYLRLGTQYHSKSKVLLNNYGFCYAQQKQWDKAIRAYRSCIETDPSSTLAYLGLCGIYQTLADFDKELDVCAEALVTCRECPELYNSYGLALLHNRPRRGDISIKTILKTFQKGLDSVSSASVKPDGNAQQPTESTSTTHTSLLINVGHVHGLLGDFPKAVAHYLDAIESVWPGVVENVENVKGTAGTAYHNILANLVHFSDSDLSRSVILSRLVNKWPSHSTKSTKSTNKMSFRSVELHRHVCELLYSSSYKLPLQLFSGKSSNPNQRIRVGYLLADLADTRLQACARHLWEKKNPHGFDVVIYHSREGAPKSKGEAGVVKRFSMYGKSSKEVAQEVQRDRIDILIDLCGHNAGNRLDVMALRPAPALLSYLGYSTDTGVRHVQRITDEYCMGATITEEDERFPAPVILPVGTPFLAYSGPGKEIQSQLAGCGKSYSRFKPTSSPVMFGCFAELSKINSVVIATWKVLLARFPRGRLVIKSSLFSDSDVRESWKKKFGMEFLDRVLLLEDVHTEEAKRMSLYNTIDVHLDTFPASDVYCTLESLYMNVPVITLSSTQATQSILTSAGLEEHCIAQNPSDYIRKAMDMTNMFQQISVSKSLLQSSVYDSQKFMRIFENMLIDVYVTTST